MAFECKAKASTEKVKVCYLQYVHTKGKLCIPSTHTSQNSFNKWIKISSLEITIFDLRMVVKSGLDFFYFKIQ